MGAAASQITQLQLLKYVPDSLRTEIAGRLRSIRASKGRTVVEKGSRSEEVFFLLEGQAEVLRYSANGREVSVNAIGPGDIFGELAALDGGPRSATVTASSDLHMLAMRDNDFMKCLESSPAAGIWLARRLAAGMRRLTEQVFELSALNVQTRIHCELLRLAQRGVSDNGTIAVRPAPTHAEFASRVGTHREAVTREIQALTKANIIRHGRRSLIILDLARLERMAIR